MIEKCGLTALNILNNLTLCIGSDSGKLFIVELYKEFQIICFNNIHSATITGFYQKINIKLFLKMW